MSGLIPPRGMRWLLVASACLSAISLFLLATASQFDVRWIGREGPLEWHVDVDNALDNRIETGKTPLVTLAPGRAVRVGITYRR